MINFKQEPTFSTKEITSEIASDIYALIKTYGDADSAYKEKGNSDIEPEHFKIVNDELQRLASEISLMKSGGKILEPAYPATYKEDGEIDEEEVPAVYLDGSVKENLVPYLSSELLDINQVLTDLYE